MNSFELNKLFGAVLFAGLVAMTAWLISLAAYGKFEHGAHERVVHYRVAGLEQEARAHDAPAHDAAAAEEAAGESVPLATLLAHADAAKGQKAFKKCAACHTVAQGGKNKIGPNLWNVVNRPVASVADFAYSEAMTGLGGVWDFARLDGFLADPKGTVSGTKMVFKGLSKGTDRANVLAFLRSLSESPAALPAEE